MRTPNEYVNNLKQNIITEEMLESALYSVDNRIKKAEKNERFIIKGMTFRLQKEVLLLVLKPKCIFEVFEKCKRIRIFNDMANYDEIFKEKYNNIVWMNSYWDCIENREKEFFDYEEHIPGYQYYLFYETSNEKIYYPIPLNEVEKYDLPIKRTLIIESNNDDTRKLMSNQFVDKIVCLIKNGEYKYLK